MYQGRVRGSYSADSVRAGPGGPPRHLEPPCLAPVRTRSFDRAQDERVLAGCIELGAPRKPEGIGTAGIEEPSVGVADEGRRDGGMAPQNGHERTAALLVGRGSLVEVEGRGFGEGLPDREHGAQALGQESLDRLLQHRHTLVGAALLERADGAPAEPQQRPRKRQDDQRHERHERDAEGNGPRRRLHFYGLQRPTCDKPPIPSSRPTCTRGSSQ